MGRGGGGQPPCPISSTGLTISVFRDPPFTEFENSKVKGILGGFFEMTMKQCIIKAQECNLSEKYFRRKLFNSTTSFMLDIEENKTDIAFPILRPMKMSLSKHDHSNTESSQALVRLELFLTSPAYLLIMDVDNVNRKVSRQELNALFENSWPIVAFTLLIAGISGMVMWILVRWTVSGIG